MPAIRDALLGPQPHVLHELRYSVHRTTPLGSDKTERTCKVYVCNAAKIWELPGLRRASIDPKLPPGAPPPGVVAKCWVNNPRRCRIAARPFRNSAGMELYADLCATIDTLNGNGKFGAQAIGDGPSPITLHPIKSYIPTFLHVGEPVPTSGPMGISGYCITMWIISTDAPTETAADPAHFGGLLLPSTLLHPSVIALVDKEGGGGKVTQPLYTAPCADLRAKRIVHDGTAVRWTLPTLTGGTVRIPSTPLLNLHIAPNSAAWRMGGANDTYLAPARRGSTENRADQRKIQKARRTTADPDMMDVVIATLDDAWGPRRLKGCARRSRTGSAPPLPSRRRRRLGISPAVPKISNSQPFPIC